MEIKQIKFQDWDDCYQVGNSKIDLVIPSCFGIRILRFGFLGQVNEFAVVPPAGGKDIWNIYGGHRLWHAPESKPRSYQPDNLPVAVEIHSDKIKVCQSEEEHTGIKKEMEVQNLKNLT